MKRTVTSTPKTSSNGVPEDRERIEILRFDSDEAQAQAVRVLRERGMLNFSGNRLNEWIVYTSVARKLREHGVPFHWLTEYS